MKKIMTMLLLAGVLTLGLAVDATIDEQIEEIKNAPAQERVKLMNQLKLRLHAMNKEERKDAISKMQTKMQATGEMTHAQARERERIRKAQMQSSGDMVRAQNMHQKRIGNQVGGDSQTVKIPTH